MGVTEGKATMRRLLVIAMAAALFLSVTAGVVAAHDVGWTGRATGDVVADNAPYVGLEVSLVANAKPSSGDPNGARGHGKYALDGNAFRLKITHACVTYDEHTVSVWGIATVKSGSFDDGLGGTLEKGDRANGFLSLLDHENGSISARAEIAAGWDPIGDAIALNCEYYDSANFPATGPGELVFKAK